MESGEVRHSINICMRCLAGQGQPGLLLERLRQLLAPVLAEAFTLRGVSSMAGCARPLTVAFSAPGKTSYLFGDIEPDTHASDLAAFAGLYRLLSDGWCHESERPRGLAGKTLARIPAAEDGRP
jgi:predicted metal-binding protein